jgi:hypothetical protein
MKFKLFLATLICLNLLSKASNPVLTINSSGDTINAVLTPFTPSAATAFDAEDGNISEKIKVESTVSSYSLGIYFISYEVTDSDGNTSRDTVWVSSVDTTPPIIEGKNGSLLKIEVGSIVDPLDYLVLADNYDTNEDIKANKTVIFSNLNLEEAGLYSYVLRTEDNSGNQSKDFTLMIDVGEHLSIENQKNQNISIFPNPAQNEINIAMNLKDVNLTIYNNMGQEMLYEQWKNSPIDISILPKGIYTIRISNAHKSLSPKVFIKQ